MGAEVDIATLWLLVGAEVETLLQADKTTKADTATSTRHARIELLRCLRCETTAVVGLSMARYYGKEYCRAVYRAWRPRLGA